MPEEIGEVLPMRYIRIEESDNISNLSVNRYVITCPFNDNASSFHSDNETLNKICFFANIQSRLPHSVNIILMVIGKEDRTRQMH